MTEQEAKLILDVRISRFDHANDVNKALEVAKAALEEIQQYRQIGTLEECQEAREKQKRIKSKDGEYCPLCFTFLKDEDGIEGNYCPNCGQAIDWREEENNE